MQPLGGFINYALFIDDFTGKVSNDKARNIEVETKKIRKIKVIWSCKRNNNAITSSIVTALNEIRMT